MTSSGVAAAASAASALPEAAFPHADDRLAALVRIMPAVVYSVSPSGNFISGQSSWHAFTGRSFPESADTGWLQAYHEDDRPKLFARFAAATLPAPSDAWYSHARLWSVKHSEHRRMLCRSFLIRDPTTHLPREWLSVDVEIASPPAQPQQTPTSSLLYLSLSCAPAGSFTFVLRSDLGIVSVSLDENARKLTDPPLPSNMSFDEWLSFIHHEDQATMRTLFSDTTLCASVVDFRFRVGNSDRWVKLRGSVHTGEDGEPGAEPPRLLGVLSDVTEVIRQEELRRARLQREHARAVDLANSAEELRRQQQEFVDTICHEIRNPLQGIVGAVQVLREELAEVEATLKGNQSAIPAGTPIKNGSSPFPSLYAHLDTISECARLQRVITDDVLEMSRLAAGVSQLALETFPLRRLFTSLRSVFAAVVEMRHLTFTMRVVNVTLESDYTRLSQIIANLLSAVLKFTQERGVITLSASVAGEQRDTLCVTIEDLNLSLNDDQLTKLLQRFSAAPPAPAAAAAGGFGLGLSIARRHLDLLCGSVTYSSGEGGRGTRIVMRVPVSKVADVAPRVPSPVITPWSHTRQLPRALHVLLVEDNAVIRTILERLVRSVGCTYQSAENGAEAVEIYRKTLVPFDAVLMDFRMPVMNGIEATRRIRQIEHTARRPRTRIIGLTGDTRREQKEEAMQVGMDDYLTKPYQRDEVLSALANCPPPAPVPLTDGTNTSTGGTGPAPAVSSLS